MNSLASYLKEKLIYYHQHRFIRNVAFLQIASALGTFFQALFGVFIARILQPELYGLYALAFSLAALIFITTGIQETITVVLGGTFAKNDREQTTDALAFFLKFNAISSVITLVIVLFLPLIGRFFYHDAHVGLYASLVVVAAIISSFAFTIVTMALQVSGNIKKMAWLGLSDQILRSGLTVVFVVFGYGILGAAIGNLLGAMVIFFVSVVIWQKNIVKYPIFPSLGELLKKVSRAKSQFLSLSIWVAIDKNLSMLYTILPVLIAGIYLSRSDVSYFKLSFGFVMLALSLLGPISTLLNSEFSKMQISDSRQMSRNFIRVSLYAVGISTVLTLAAIIVAPILFKILYGVSFLPSVKYVPGLFIFGALFGIGVGLGPMWRVVNRVRTSVVINLVVLAVGIPVGIYLIQNFGVWGGIIMVTAWFTIAHLASFFYLLAVLK